jgi:TonB family protein
MRTFIVAFVVTAMFIAAPAAAQQDIIARDGDRIIVDDDARIQIVRRRQAMVRTVFLEPQKTLIVVMDYARGGQPPDGRPDVSIRYENLTGKWPLEPRWEGFTNVFEYSATSDFPTGLGLMTPNGMVQLLPTTSSQVREPSATIMTFSGYGGGGANGATYDEAERFQLVQVGGAAALPRTASGMSSGVSGSIGAEADATGRQWSARSAPRTGGSLLRKVRDVAPVYPEQARRANVHGIVILQIAVGSDGRVLDAKVVRSVPLLDAAAMDAVRQWQYEPTGTAAPITLTVPVAVTP